MFGYIDAN